MRQRGRDVWGALLRWAAPPDPPPPGRRQGWIAALAAGAAWVALLALRLATVDPDLWRHRDDAVITLSHARGLVELGTVSVSAVPELVEGYSTPLQFALAVPYYWLGGTGWGPFLDAQVVVCTVLCGFFAARLVHAATGIAGWRLTVAAAAAACVAFWPYTTAGWFASGMENPLTGMLLLGTSWGLVAYRLGRWPPLATAAMISLLGVVRVEFALFAALFIPIGVVLAVARGNRRHATLIAVVPLVFWTVVHLARVAYFGSLVPNSGMVQDKASPASALRWVVVVAITVSVVVLVDRVVAPRLERGTGRRWLVRAVRLGAAFVATLATTTVVSATPLEPPSLPTVSGSVLSGSTGVLMVAMVLAGCWIVGVKLSDPATAIVAVAACVPILQVAAFGPARLDDLRISGLAIVPSSVLVAIAVIRVVRAALEHEGPRWSARRVTIASVVGAAGAGVLLLVLSPSLPGLSTAAAEEDLCCGVSPLDEELLDVAAALQEETDLPLVITGNVDLGKLSHAKETVVVDLGLLGSPFVARVVDEVPELRDELILDVLAPDVIELHAAVSCGFRTLTDDPRFTSRYAIDEGSSRPDAGFEVCPNRGWRTFYVRVGDPEFVREAALAAALASGGPGSLVEEAIDGCDASSGGLWRCQWVRRSVERALPFLSEEQVSTIARAIDRSPTAELDRILLFERTSAGWDRRALAAFRRLAASAEGASQE